MELKLALLAIHLTLLIFFVTRPLILTPKRVFGVKNVDSNSSLSTITDYDGFGNNSTNLSRFYTSSAFIRLIFIGFVVFMLLFVATLLSDLFSVDSPKPVTHWAKGTSELELTILNKKTGKTIANGPISSGFYVSDSGKVFPVNNKKNRLLFIVVDKNGPSVINARSAAELFGVTALFLAIACLVLWLVHREP